MNPRTDASATRAGVRVLPMRFTANIERMREFLALLGCSTKVSREGSWVAMAGAAGMVALHAVHDDRPDDRGRTDLWFETTDLDALRAVYLAAGFRDVEVFDEAFGRELTVRDRDGRTVGFEQPSDDLYGYRLDQPRPEHDIVSMPILAEDPAGTFGRLLLPAGFDRLDEGDDTWRVWGGAGGMVALRRPATDGAEVDGSVQLGFRTHEPLTELAERLTAAGHTEVTLSETATPAEPGAPTGRGELTVTDPDGRQVLVQPLA